MADNTNDNSNDEECINETGSDKSFVGKFVSGLISNTPLSKWFKNSNSNNSATRPAIRRRGDENYDDDDDDEDSFIVQPPVKRAKLPTLNDTTTTTTTTIITNEIQRNSFRTTPSKLTQNNNVKVFNSFLEPIPGPSGIQKRKLFVNNIDRDQNDSLINGNIEQNDTDDSEEESTSGYSSSAPLKSIIIHENNESNTNVIKVNKADLNEPETDNNNSNNNNNLSDVNNRTSATIRSLFNSPQDGSRSLFSERSLSPNISNNNNASLSSRRPNFNPSILGTPNFIDKTLTTKRILNSPFYSGRTMYGGSSALNLTSLNRNINTKTTDNSNNNNSRLASSVVIKPTNKKLTNNDNITLSKTARRILNTLEQYSTPISDAKKIPISPKTNDKSINNSKSGLLSKYIGANPYILRPTKSLPSNKELQIPDLLQMKQKERLQNSTENVRQIAITSKSDLNKEEYRLAHDDDNNNNDNNNKKQQIKQSKYVNKIKNNLTSIRQNKIQIIQNEVINDVKLPNVSLPITTLPKLDFVLPPPQPPSQQQQKQPQQQQINDKLEKRSTIKSDENNINFKFSKPVIISKNFKTIQAINCFKFSEPVDKKEKHNKNMTTTKTNTLNFKMPENTIKLPLSKLKNNGEKCIVKPVPELITTGSCIDILKNNNSNNSSNDNSLDKFKPNKDTWECTACLVRNDNDKNQCIACEMERVKSSNDNDNNNKTLSSFGDKFKPLPTTWECQTCMIRNKNELNKCEACQTENPNSKKSTSLSSTSQPTFNFGLKPTNTDTWECSSCWVRNKLDADKCIACQSVRNKSQNTLPPSQNQQQPPQFSFGDKLQALQTWECPSCMIRNKNELNKCEACETVKPNIQQSKNTYSFGIQSLTNNDWDCKSCKTKNEHITNKCQKCGILKDVNNVNKGFGDLFKLKQSEWECTSCLVRNKNDVVKCACCGTLKPGCNDIDTSNITTDKTTVSFNFGIDNNFKFGIPTTSSTTSTTTTKTNENQTTSGTASSIFGAPVKTTTTTTSSGNSTSTNGFSFGIKPQTESKTNEDSQKTEEPTSKTESAPSFKFGVDNSITSPKTSETTAIFPNKVEVPASLSADGLSKKPTFEYKPVNGDINKPNLFAPTTSITATTSTSKEQNVFAGKPSITGTVTTSAPTFKFGSNSSTSTAKTLTTAVTTTTTTTVAVAITTPMAPVTATTATGGMFKFGSANIQSTAISSTKRSFGDVSSSSENSKAVCFGKTTKSLSFGTATTTTTTSSSSGFGSMTNEKKFATAVDSSKAPGFGTPDNKPLGTFSFGNTDTKKTINFGGLDQNKSVSFSNNLEQKPITGFGLNNNSSFGTNETKQSGFGSLSNSKLPFAVSEPKPLVPNFGATESKPTFGTTPSASTNDPKPNIFGNTNSKSTSFGNVSSSGQKPSMFGTSEPAKPFSFGNPTTNSTTSNDPKSTSFTFGQQQQQQQSDNKLNEASQPFKFVGIDPNISNAGGFNFSMTPSVVPNTTFNFGNNNSTKTETITQPAQNQGIFGGSNISNNNGNNNNNNNNSGTSWAKTGSFNFGTAANNNNQKAIFTFGASQTNQTSFSTTQQPTNTVALATATTAIATAVAPQTAGFNFGASAPTVSTGGFNFTGAMPTFNFTDGSTNTAQQPQRKLRKALRRIPR